MPALRHASSTILAVALLLATAPAQLICRTLIITPTASGTWTRASSPYCVTVDLNMGNLTIQAGVVVLVDPGKTITVAAPVQFLGTETEPILFTERSSGQGWSGFLFASPVPGTVLQNCVVEKAVNSGVRIVDSALTFRSCVFRNNQAAATGGAVLANVVNGDLAFQDCQFLDNSAPSHGGGLRVTMGSGTTLRMDRCTIEDNASNPNTDITGWHWGGGLHLVGEGVLRNCVFRGNVARTHAYGCSVQLGRGGGVFADGGSLTMENCIVSQNLAFASGAGCCCLLGADARGGGVAFVAAQHGLTMSNCILCGNQVQAVFSDRGGPLIHAAGGLHVEANASANLSQCTIVNNTVEGLGNANSASSTGVVVIANSILYFNNPLGTNPPTYGNQIQGAVTATFCDVQNGLAGTGNMAANPFLVRPDCDLGAAVIHPFSPCVDAGDPVGPADTAFPPSRGGPTADLGAHGGPGAARFAPPCLVSGGAQGYGRGLAGDNRMTLEFVPQGGALTGLIRARGAATPLGLLLLGFAPARTRFGDQWVLVDTSGPLAFVFVKYGAAGDLEFPFTLADPALIGVSLYLQAFDFVTPRASNGLVTFFY